MYDPLGFDPCSLDSGGVFLGARCSSSCSGPVWRPQSIFRCPAAALPFLPAALVASSCFHRLSWSRTLRFLAFCLGLAWIIGLTIVQSISFRCALVICMSSAHSSPLSEMLLQPECEYGWHVHPSLDGSNFMPHNCLCAIVQHFYVTTLLFVLWMHFTNPVVGSLLPRISE